MKKKQLSHSQHRAARGLLLKTNPSMIITIDSIAECLRTYPFIWKKYVQRSAKLGIDED